MGRGRDRPWLALPHTRTADVTQAGEVSSVVSSPEQVFNTVREWLDRCQPGPAGSGRSNE